MCLTIEDGVLSLLTTLSFVYHSTSFADKMSRHRLLPNEVRYDVHRLYKTGKLTDHHLKCRILQAVNDFVSSNEIEKVSRVIMVLEGYTFGFKSMKDYLCKLLCVRGKGMGLILLVHVSLSHFSKELLMVQ